MSVSRIRQPCSNLSIKIEMIDRDPEIPITMLCPTCKEVPKDFFFGNRDRFGADQSGSKYFELPFTIETLRQSALAGCELCALISNNLSKDQYLGEEDAWSTCTSNDSLPTNENIRVCAIPGNVLNFIGMKQGLAFKGALIFDKHGRMKPISERSDSDQCFQQLATWIKDCIQNHNSCGPINSNRREFLPTRLLDVGTSDSKSNSIHLVLGSDVRTKNDARYLSLSHCWGNSIPESATTTTATLTSHLQHIPMETLTKNFRDTCFVARNLGIRYVWIDSLCIVQDSLEDWTRESKLMGKVFSHSYCTLGAALHPPATPEHFSQSQPKLHSTFSLADDGLIKLDSKEENGLLVRRSPEVVGMVTLSNITDQTQQDNTRSKMKLMSQRFKRLNPFHKDSETMAQHKPRKSPEEVSIYPVLPEWDESYDQCSLRDRGWTVQERELSVRSVFYTRDQMIWECQSRQATEQYPTPQEYKDPHCRLFFARSQDKTRDLHSWYTMVEDYTNRKLSYQNDKLPAISGLAESFEIASGLARYVAGLWEDDLIEGLLWCVTDKSLSGHKWPEGVKQDYLGPSWSWVSVNSPVQWWSRHLVKHWSEAPNQHTRPRILRCETVPQGLDPRGRLVGGWLRIEGVLRKCVLGDRDIPITWRSHFAPYVDGGWPKPENGEIRWDPFTLHGSEQEFFILPIYLRPEEGHIRHSLGLLLTPTEGENTYRRLGFMSHLPPEDYQDLERQVIVLV